MDLAWKEELGLVRELRHKLNNPNSQSKGVYTMTDAQSGVENLSLEGREKTC